MTKEIQLGEIQFKELTKKSLCDVNFGNYGKAVEKVASKVIVNEENIIAGLIIVIETDCSYTPIAGNGCHIELIEYASNIPNFEVYDLIRLFTNGVLFFGIKENEDGDGDCIRKYDYIWFDLEDISKSSIFSYYKEKYKGNMEEVYSEDDLHVYVVRLKKQ